LKGPPADGPSGPSVAPPDAGGAGQAQGRYSALKGAAVGAVIHQEAPARTLADCLDPQRPCSGEQVQHRGAFQRKTDAELSRSMLKSPGGWSLVGRTWASSGATTAVHPVFRL
jgi:hypothetical protein